eukprot:m.95829 g.95829  ORF g.95829 m.95829 type:complete len:135 (-) comp26848_c0_seq10:1110-1514(-)
MSDADLSDDEMDTKQVTNGRRTTDDGRWTTDDDNDDDDNVVGDIVVAEHYHTHQNSAAAKAEASSSSTSTIDLSTTEDCWGVWLARASASAARRSITSLLNVWFCSLIAVREFDNVVTFSESCTICDSNSRSCS